MPTPMPYTEVITGAAQVITDFGLWGFVIAGLVVALAVYMFRRAGAKTR